MIPQGLKKGKPNFTQSLTGATPYAYQNEVYHQWSLPVKHKKLVYKIPKNNKLSAEKT